MANVPDNSAKRHPYGLVLDLEIVLMIDYISLFPTRETIHALSDRVPKL